MKLHQQYRDIEWLVNSPSLISSKTPKVSTITIVEHLEDFISLFSNDLHPQSKSDEVYGELSSACTSYKRLGRYAECLFSGWAEAHPAVTVFDKGIQIRDASNQTLGELDFLLKVGGQPVHLEMAVNYYLMADDKVRLSSFVGPNPRDRFDLKYSKLVDQQIQWLQKDQLDKGLIFDTQLSTDQLHQQWNRALLVKGMLFFHWRSDRHDLQLPEEINPDCDKGTWCYKQEWKDYVETQNRFEKWIILPKLRWLSSAEPQDKSEILTPKEVLSVIKQTEKPVMAAGLIEDETQHLKESTRLIIVPNNWNT